jgi:serine/threonine protein kinase
MLQFEINRDLNLTPTVEIQLDGAEQLPTIQHIETILLDTPSPSFTPLKELKELEYRLVKEISSSEFIASHPMFGTVLVKKCRKDSEDYERFCLESKILRTCQSAHIQRLFETWEVEEFQYISLEHTNQTLRQLMSHGFHPMQLMYCIEQFIDGVAFLHSYQVAHFSITPENIGIFYQPNGSFVCKIMNFDQAQEFDYIYSQDFQEKVQKKEISLSNYSSYEFIVTDLTDGQLYNEKADVWSLGCIIYELLTYRQFMYYNDAALENKMDLCILQASELEVYSDEYQLAKDIMLKCLQKNVTERFEAYELVQLVIQYIKEEYDESAYL